MYLVLHTLLLFYKEDAELRNVKQLCGVWGIKDKWVSLRWDLKQVLSEVTVSTAAYGSTSMSHGALPKGTQLPYPVGNFDESYEMCLRNFHGSF